MRKFIVCALAIAVLMPVALVGQTVDTIDPALRERIDRIAAGVMQERGVPSASVAVVKSGKLVYTHAYGKAHIDPDKPATPDMRYSIGSISKQFTATAILMLQEQGKLSLDDAVGKYVPGLTRGDEVTIRQILSHTAGYQDYWPEDYLMTPMMKPSNARQIVDTWAKKPLDFEPGTQWQYSNTGYVIAGLMVEKVSGEKLFDFLGEHIFHPLGMKSVWNSDEIKLTEPDAWPYIRAALGPMRPAPKEGRGWMFAAGELAMTAHDLALWDESLIARSLLKAESYKEMFTEVKLNDGKGTHYGLGVGVGKMDGHLDISHSGEVTGFVSDNEVLVDDGVAVAVLTNHMAGGAGEIARLAASAVVGSKPGRRAGACHLSRPAEGAHRPQPAGVQSERLFRCADGGRFSRQPRPAGRAAAVSAGGRKPARRDDVSQISNCVSDAPPESYHVYLSRREAGAVPGVSAGLRGGAAE